MNILEEIAARTRERIAKEKSDISVSELENRIQEVNLPSLISHTEVGAHMEISSRLSCP